jgi:hypothetical protein
VTFDVAALNDVAVFPQESRAVSVLDPVNGASFTWGEATTRLKEAAEAGLTVTVRSPPSVELIDASETEIATVSARYSLITPLLPPETVATPFTNVMLVEDPKGTWAPPASVTEGGVTGFKEAEAPENVRDFGPS